MDRLLEFFKATAQESAEQNPATPPSDSSGEAGKSGAFAGSGDSPSADPPAAARGEAIGVDENAKKPAKPTRQARLGATKGRALVLSGGGARGAYQIGVWKALRELGMEFDIITGTSVGALNGAMMVQDDFEAAEKVWREISLGDVLDLDMPGLDLMNNKQDMRNLLGKIIKSSVSEGGTGISALAATMERALCEDAMRASPVDFQFVTVRYPSLEPAYFRISDIPEGRIVEYLMASAACFPVFKAHLIDGEMYIDGGFYDNIPINLALDMGAREIVVVDLRAFGIHQRMRRNNADIIYIRPQRSLGNLVTFDKNFSERNMIWGYHDAMKAFSHLDGEKFTFDKGEGSAMVASLAPAFASCLHLVTAGGRGAVDKMIESRIYSLLGSKRVYGGTYGDLLPICAELAAEFFKLDECRVYDHMAFNDALKDRYGEWLGRWQRLMPDFKPSVANFPQASRYLSLRDKRAVTAFLVWCLEQAREGRMNHSELQRWAIAFAKEMAAAMYVYSLLQSS